MFYKTDLLFRGLTIERGLTFQYLRYALFSRKYGIRTSNDSIVTPSINIIMKFLHATQFVQDLRDIAIKYKR